jgi:Cu(I)-responsive transcriptional regulator
MNIGEAATAAGVSAKMIRHYEQIGLLPPAMRTGAGYRQYGERDVSVLRFIRQSRRLGFSMQQIADLLALWSNTRRASRKVKVLAEQHVADLEQKMREMAEMKQALEHMIASCRGDDHAECAIIDGLAADSPSAPEPGSIEAGPLHKPGRDGAAKRAAKGPPATLSTSHIDLMDWARNAHGRQGKH